MGNISQSSKRSALKEFDVYFKHENKMSRKKVTPIMDLLNDLGCGESLTISKGDLSILLLEEKKLIKEAFEDGHRMGDSPHRKLLSSTYYNEEFKQ